MDWKTCISNRLAKESRADPSMANALIKSSGKRIKTSRRLKIDTVSAETVVSLKYEALRELLESIALKNRYKIYNHECFGAFLKEVLGREDLSASFDRLRKIRNAINYYGHEISPADAKDISDEIEEMIDTLIASYT